MSALIRENVTEGDRELLKAALTGMEEGSHLRSFLAWVLHELDDHAANVTVGAHGMTASVVLLSRRIPMCSGH